MLPRCRHDGFGCLTCLLRTPRLGQVMRVLRTSSLSARDVIAITGSNTAAGRIMAQIWCATVALIGFSCLPRRCMHAPHAPVHGSVPPYLFLLLLFPEARGGRGMGGITNGRSAADKEKHDACTAGADHACFPPSPPRPWRRFVDPLEQEPRKASTEGLVAHWAFRELSPVSTDRFVKDWSGNGYDGIIEGPAHRILDAVPPVRRTGNDTLCFATLCFSELRWAVASAPLHLSNVPLKNV